MKKLITLLLVLTGMVTTASADYTVYFKPSGKWTQAGGEVFKLHLWGDGEDKFITFSSYANGIYSATYPADYNATGFQFVRYASDGTTDWTWGSNRTDFPTSTVYYDASNNDDWELDGLSATLPSDKTFYISNCEDEILPNYLDANSGAGTNLTSNDDFTYSRTVTGNVIPAGTYSFKLTDESANVYSNNNNPWPVSNISTEADAVYTIVYSYDFIKGEASATATKTADATITEKYVIGGSEKLLGHDWDVSGNYNVMTVENGTGTLVLNNVTLEANYNTFKAVQLLCNNGTPYKSIWAADPNSVCDIKRTSVYNVTFTCDIATLESSANAQEVAGFFVYGGSSSWGLIGRMTEKDGTYTYDFNAASGTEFIITPNTNLNEYNSVVAWDNVIRPDFGQITINWALDGGDTEIADEGGKKWKISYNGNIEFAYTPSTGKWSVEPYIIKDFTGAPTANSKFYTTFSNVDLAVAMPTGVTAYYADNATSGAGVIKMVAFEKGIAKETGAFLAAAEAKEYHFTPAAETDDVAANNLFVAGNGVLAYDANKTQYVFAKQDDDLGFYKVGEGFSVDMTGKAYIEASGSLAAARQLAFVIDEESTGIAEIETVKKMDNNFYNLAGQRVAQPVKGLYIVNGKKVIMK